MNLEKEYSRFLERINNAKNLESLYQDTFEILHNVFHPDRVQLWEKLSESNEMSTLHEYFAGNKRSMLKFRIRSLPQKAIGEIWECNHITDTTLKEFNIKSLIGLSLCLPEQKEGLLILASEEDKKYSSYEFLIKLKTQFEIGITKIDELENSISETKRLYNQNIALREHERTRINFINNISHEFKTPLASILGFTKMLLTKNHLSESTKEIGEQILQAASRLSSLINDFLEINKTTIEGWSVHPEPCDIGEIVKKSVEEFDSLNKKHKISYIVSDNYPILQTDSKLVRQVLDNLILNAIKYSPNGGNITVSLQVSQNKKDLEVSVSDQGIGIDKDEILKIFNRLYRSSNPIVQKVAGSGLGLAICQEIITALNGKITVESKLDKGSTFTVTLPIT